MTDRLEIFRLMGVPPRGILIETIHLVLFGKTLVLDCLYDPEAPKRFKIRFEDCTKINWELYNELDERDKALDVVDIVFKQDQNSQWAEIVSEVVIDVWHKSVHIEKDW
ncbi:MAG: hypothetical protein DPW16_03215 [Chloroflexi bacterium]|nr:hypothetical protein [Chloroflexota bacterium]